MVLTIGLYTFAGKEGIPQFNEGSFTISMQTPYGSDLNLTKNLSKKVSDEIKKVDGVSRVSSITGRAGGDPHDSGSNQSEIYVQYSEQDSKTSYERTAEIQKVLSVYKDEALFSIGQPITHRVEEIISGVRAPIVIKVFGNNLEAMDSLGEEIKTTLSQQPGVLNPTIKKAVEVPEVRENIFELK